MRILENLTAAELKGYTGRPTAKDLREKNMRDGKYIPPGDKVAAKAYIAGKDTGRQVNDDIPRDTVKISAEGQALADNEAGQISFSWSRLGETNNFRLTFDNSAMLHRAVKQGYIEVEGSKISLSDEVKKQLLATDKQLQANREHIARQNFLLHEAANARQTSDAMKEANDKMSRAMTTAVRIMHGRKVSPADEKELMEFNKDLYAMAKSAASLAEHRHKNHDKDDEKISKANDEARAREAEPKDYSVEETPLPCDQAQITVSMEGDGAKVMSVGEGLPD